MCIPIIFICWPYICSLSQLYRILLLFIQKAFLKYLMKAFMLQDNLNHSSPDSFNFLIILVFPQQMFSSLLTSFKIWYLELNIAFLVLSDQCRVQFAITSLEMYILLLLNRLKHLYFCLVLSFLILRLIFNSI